MPRFVSIVLVVSVSLGLCTFAMAQDNDPDSWFCKGVREVLASAYKKYQGVQFNFGDEYEPYVSDTYFSDKYWYDRWDEDASGLAVAKYEEMKKETLEVCISKDVPRGELDPFESMSDEDKAETLAISKYWVVRPEVTITFSAVDFGGGDYLAKLRVDCDARQLYRPLLPECKVDAGVLDPSQQ